MKLNVNTNAIKKGMFLTGLSLMCVSASGCTKKEQAENVSVVVDQKDDDNKLKVAKASETLEILDAYNSVLKDKKLDVDDLEYMSQFNNGIFSIKSYDGELLQIDGEDYRFVNLDNNDNSLTIEYTINNVPNSMKVGEYIDENNIKIDAYTFPMAKVWGEKEKEKIIEKYGKDTFKCVQEYGLPVVMYSYKSFGAEDVVLKYSKQKAK